VSPEEQILPLDPERWIERIEAWHSTDLSELGQASAARAREQTWEDAASRTARILETVDERTG
jgi:hypothetical protein